jgi:cellulose synthase/poly-beta-1,6-N-acetylglucosamine synthase-like glycosyltransferase
MSLRVSVVIPTYRRPELLGRCLDALAAQMLTPDSYEILVADDAAEPGNVAASRGVYQKSSLHNPLFACDANSWTGSGAERRLARRPRSHPRLYR